MEMYHRRVRGSECVEAEETTDESSANDSQYRDDNYASTLSTPSESPVLKASKPCGDDYLDKVGKTEKCIKKKDCTGVPYDSGGLCLPDDDYGNWNSYKVYLLVNGKDRSYVDLDTCLKKGNRYAYKYGECSLLKPDNSGGRSF